MLEAIRERAQGWIAKIILGLIVLAFALWGVDWYFQGGGKEPAVATVGDGDITQRDFFEALKQQRDAMGIKGDIPPTVDQMLRQQVADQLIDVRLVTLVGQDAGFAISDAQLNTYLGGIELFQENGQFSQARLDAFLRSKGWSQQKLLTMVRQDLLLRQVQFAYAEGVLASNTGTEQVAKLLTQQREVNEVIYDRKAFLNLIKIDDAAVEQFYKAHQQDYAVPAQVRVQYTVLSQDAIGKQIQITEAAARQTYEANKARYQQPENRRASHILIQAGPDAKAKAEKVLKEVKANPARFADLAKQYSDDPGSAARGGDLGSFGREMMVKPFADAAFQMKKGEIGGLVETQFGYHIIRLDDIISGAVVAFDKVKGEIMQDLQKQEAARKFAEVAERFSNLVYEQPDSLQAAATEFKLTLEESGWISAGRAEPAILNNPRLMEALFARDALEKKQNTEAIEVATNTLVAARVLEHRPASTRPLTEVAGVIRLQLQAEAAGKKAVEAGQQALEAARNGSTPGGLSAGMTLSRMRPLNLPPAAVRAVFKADVAKLPAWTGVETADGYRLYRINRVNEGEMPAEQTKQLRRDIKRLLAQTEMRAFLDGLKERYKVEINQKILSEKAE